MYHNHSSSASYWLDAIYYNYCEFSILLEPLRLRMSRRPRLVEAGESVDKTSSNHDIDVFLETEYQNAVGEHHHRHHQTDRHAHKPKFRISSLGAAAALSKSVSTVPKRTHKIQTKLVIGEGKHPTPKTKPKQSTRKLVTNFEITDNSGNRHSNNSFDSHSSMMEVENEHKEINSHHFHSLQHSVEPMHHQFLQHPPYHGTELEDTNLHDDQTERMEIDDIHLQRLPIVIMDGANVAYAYAQATGTNSTSLNTTSYDKNSIEPNFLGIEIAVSYFMRAGCRVQVVVPQYFHRRKPRGGNNHSANALAASPQLDILNKLKDQNILCCSPPADDDDSYSIAIARRIDAKFCERRKGSSLSTYAHTHWSTSNDLTSIGGAFILSNDLFRDAQKRDTSGDFAQWLGGDDDMGLTKRLSYSFAELGSINKYGDLQLDFIPNPRHPLVAMIERLNRNQNAI